jgi:hypothetical protein
MTELEKKMLAELRAVLPLLDLAFNHDGGGGRIRAYAQRRYRCV